MTLSFQLGSALSIPQELLEPEEDREPRPHPCYKRSMPVLYFLRASHIQLQKVLTLCVKKKRKKAARGRKFTPPPQSNQSTATVQNKCTSSSSRDSQESKRKKHQELEGENSCLVPTPAGWEAYLLEDAPWGSDSQLKKTTDCQGEAERTKTATSCSWNLDWEDSTSHSQSQESQQIMTPCGKKAGSASLFTVFPRGGTAFSK